PHFRRDRDRLVQGLAGRLPELRSVARGARVADRVGGIAKNESAEADGSTLWTKIEHDGLRTALFAPVTANGVRTAVECRQSRLIWRSRRRDRIATGCRNEGSTSDQKGDVAAH